MVKLNTDAAMQSSGSCGFGMVLRDATGAILMSKCYRFRSNILVNDAEVETVVFGISRASEGSFTKIIFETNSLALLHHLSKQQFPSTYYGTRLLQIVDLSQ
ncbi:hypothetical protein P3X46_034987 [Hevea brasiliensis]|uniref:RNase H type-1 domain-containing protein n=1 Tax=Hevea brasiliensis TaxID=3981 RepID=A0ABQ9KB10_HEVBR|nr:hypothetical protein P3X46_034987 [Hevea brasiliensis]